MTEIKKIENFRLEIGDLSVPNAQKRGYQMTEEKNKNPFQSSMLTCFDVGKLMNLNTMHHLNIFIWERFET